MVYTHLKLKLLDYGCFEELINVSAWFVSYIRHDLCLNDDVFFYSSRKPGYDWSKVLLPVVK